MTRQGAGKLGNRSVAVEGNKLICMECEAKFDDRDAFLKHTCQKGMTVERGSGTTGRSFMPSRKKDKPEVKAADNAGADAKPAEKREAK